MKRFLAAFLAVLSALSLLSCNGAKTAAERLALFRDGYGMAGVLFSPDVPEGDTGWTDGAFLSTLFDGEVPGIADYAVLLPARTGNVEECGLFLCRDGDAVLAVADLCENRLRLLGKERALPKEQLLVERSGKTVFYGVFSDPARAKRIFRRI